MGQNDERLFEGVHTHWNAVGALPVNSAVLDGEAIVLRLNTTRLISRR